MTNMIKINGVEITNASVTESDSQLGIRYASAMSFDDLADLFNEENAPEVAFINEDGTTGALYRNHKMTSLKVDVSGDERMVTVVLQVSAIEMKEAEIINEKLALQEKMITAQKEMINSQAKQIEEQGNLIQTQIEELNSANAKINEQIDAIDELRNLLSLANSKIVEQSNELAETKRSLDEARENLTIAIESNEMLTQCVLEMSEVVYA